MSLKGKAHQGELPIKAQHNPIPVTGYFVNGESHRSVSVDSLTPNKGKNMKSGTGKKPPKKAPNKGYKSNPDGEVSQGFTVKIKESMQSIKDFAKSLEPKKQVKVQEVAQQAQKVLSATERFLARTQALSGVKKADAPEAQKEAEKEAKKLVSSVTKFVEKTSAAAAATAHSKSPTEQLRECKSQLAQHQSHALPDQGKSTKFKDVDGLTLYIGDRVIRSDDERYRNRYGVVMGVSKDQRVTVKWDMGGITNHKSHKSLRRAAPAKTNPSSAWGEMLMQVGAGVGSFLGSGAIHAGLRALVDKFAPKFVENYEALVDTGIGLVSIGGTSAIALHPNLASVRPGFLSFLALRLVNHVGRHLPKSLPPAFPSLFGAGVTSTLDGLVDLESGEVGASEVIVDVWEPTGALPSASSKRRSLAPQDWERRALR